MRGKLVSRGEGKRADYILYYRPNIPIALIEGQGTTRPRHGRRHAAGAGLCRYPGHPLRCSHRTATASCSTTGPATPRKRKPPWTTIRFRRPADLWARVPRLEGPDARKPKRSCSKTILTTAACKTPRYYLGERHQRRHRGYRPEAETGCCWSWQPAPARPTTAFQIIWRLWKAGRKKRVLFLADRNVLIDQTMVNDFRPFGAGHGQAVDQIQDPSSAPTARPRT